jgi:lathosterol oxidase
MDLHRWISEPSEARRDAAASRWRAACLWIDRLVLLALTLSGLAVDAWYPCLLVMFAAIAGPLLAGCGLTTLLCERFGPRIQGPRVRPALILRGVFDTARAAWVAACLAAWPLWLIRRGHPTGLTWSLPGSPLWLALQTVAVLLVMDAWLYWKHRLLHTRLLFPFHRDHHVYRDPTAFAGFAVGPVESLLTFWPILLVCFPAATHYGPLYFGLVTTFVVLNFYLHCGVVARPLEAVLPRIFVNTSAFHNQHHSNADVNFGEAFTLWDHLLKTQSTAESAGVP